MDSSTHRRANFQKWLVAAGLVFSLFFVDIVIAWALDQYDVLRQLELLGFGFLLAQIFLIAVLAVVASAPAATRLPLALLLLAVVWIAVSPATHTEPAVFWLWLMVTTAAAAAPLVVFRMYGWQFHGWQFHGGIGLTVGEVSLGQQYPLRDLFLGMLLLGLALATLRSCGAWAALKNVYFLKRPDLLFGGLLLSASPGFIASALASPFIRPGRRLKDDGPIISQRGWISILAFHVLLALVTFPLWSQSPFAALAGICILDVSVAVYVATVVTVLRVFHGLGCHWRQSTRSQQTAGGK